MTIGRTAGAAVVSVAVAGLLPGLVAVATPVHAVPGLVRATASTVTDSSTTKSVSAVCPAGTRVLGGGGEIVGGAGQVLLTALEPVPGSNSYRARGHEDDDGYAGSWQVRAYAMCAPSPAGLEYLSRTGPLQSSSFGNYTAVQCPTGKDLIGLGGRTNGGYGEVSLEGLGPFDPYEVLVPSAEDPDGFAGQWSLTAHVVCVTPFAGRRAYFTSVASDSTSPKMVTVTCPAGTKAHGAGFNGGGAVTGGKWLVQAMRPDPTLSSVTVVGQEVDEGTPDIWSLTAWVVCAP
jgi:hypothetical protein